MCQFISALKVDEEYFFLTKKDLKGKTFAQFKKDNKEWWSSEICGHGAIEYFYPELKGKGYHWECEDFSTPNNFPKIIVDAIKRGEFEGFGTPTEILNKEGVVEYNKINQPALDEYEKIKKPARAEYEKIQQQAKDEYRKIRQQAWAEYRKIEQPARAEYDKIEQPAWAEYNKIEQQAWDEYRKINQQARAEYRKIEQPAFWRIAKQKKFRKDVWK